MPDVELTLACSETLKPLDYDRYLACLYAAPDDRLPLLALHSFHAELGRIRESVSEPMLGEIRLTWWREAIESIADGKVRAHPVIQALAPSLQEKRLSEDALFGMIDARVADLYEEAPVNEAAMRAYAQATGGALMAQAVHVTGASAEDIGMARMIGTAMTAGGVVRSIGFHASMRRVHLPADALEEIGVDAEQIFQGEFTPQISDLCARMGSKALEELIAGLKHGFARRQRKALIPAVFSKCQLQSAQASAFDPNREPEATTRAKKMRKAWWYSLTGRG